MPRSLLLLALLSCTVPSLPAAAPPAARSARVYSVEELARRARPSIVVIRTRGRDGTSQGLGTGFVVVADGLIASNQHVIGEGRALTVELADGTRHDVTAVHASDGKNDLARRRSLCLSHREVPALPFEVAVSVKLDDEAGAAGLAFHADGGDKQ